MGVARLEDILRATRALRAGSISSDTARFVLTGGEHRIDELRARAPRNPMAYADEIAETQDAVDELRSLLLVRHGGLVRYSAPPRTTYKRTARDRAAGVLRDQGRGDVVVVRTGQIMVRRNGRARVEDGYTLYVGGVIAVGPWPRKPIMRQAHYATGSDHMGVVPEVLLLRGRRLHRYLWRRRRAYRELVRARQRARERTRKTGQLHVVGADVRVTFLTPDGRRSSTPW